MKRRSLFVGSMLVAALACRRSDAPERAHGHPHESGDTHDGESWAVTAWGRRYEVFAETDALVAGRPATSNAHLTVLADFSPLRSGAVSAVLRGPDGREERFRQEQPKRDGIFPVEIKPSREGTFDLVFEAEGPSGKEAIPAGRVRVGNAGAPGGLAEAVPEPAEGVSFLKEQQWRTAFATAWTEEGALREAVGGPGRVLPARGGSVVLTANIDAVVAPEPWPYVGLDVRGGGAVFRLRPRAGGRSVPELTAEAAALEAEAEAARKRVERLTELLQLEATSAAELERARATLAGIEARLDAARRGLAVASRGPSSGDGIAVAAPWTGQVAEVAVTPGQAVAAGDVLGRLVKPRPLWIEVALRPEDAGRLDAAAPAGLVLRRSSGLDPLEIAAGSVRLVAVAPEVDKTTATIAATLELDRSASELPIGSTVEAQILLSGERRGIVVPETALVDDSGVAVAYVQDSGETFRRREVRVLARQGTKALVDGLRLRERLVTLGGAAIRRASLLSSGAPEGHVH